MSTDFAAAEDSAPQADPISPLLALPTEIKSRIAASLHPLDACNLALTHTSLIDIAESVSWRSYTVPVGHPSGSRGPEATLTATPAASGEESIDPNVSAWTDFEQSLLARPARYKHIHILSYTLAPQAIPIAARILPKLSRLLELEQCCNPQEQSVIGEDETGSSSCVLQQCGPLVTVKKVKLHQANGSGNDLFNALHALPNAVQLWSVTFLPLKSGTPRVEPPELPHLERIVLGAHSLPNTLGPIASRAPRLSTVEVKDHPSQPGQPLKVSTHLDTCLRSETIRNISLNREMWNYLRKANRRLQGWLPNLETLCLPCAPSEECVLEHPNLRVVHLYDWKNSRPAPFGFAPTEEGGVSGWLDQWVGDALDRAPNLLYIDDFVDEDAPILTATAAERAPVTGFRFTTFKNGSETLYHARKNVDYLAPPTLLYFEEWIEREHLPHSDVARTYFEDELEGGGLVDNLGMRALMKAIRRGTATKEKVTHDLHEPINQCPGGGAEHTLELTVYGDWPLPYALLDYVYEQAGYEREWKEGRRGLELPEHVWEYLRDWHREVCMMPIPKVFWGSFAVEGS